MRRKAPLRIAPSLLSLLLLFPALGCQAPHHEEATGVVSSEPSADAERARAIEEKKAEIDRMAADIPNMQGSDQDKIDAVNRLDQARRELNDLVEGGGQ